LVLSELNGAVYYYHQDHLNSTVAVTDESANVVEQYVYGQPYFYGPDGTPRAESALGLRFLFTGREWLASLGLYDYRHRVYSPSLGRFLQMDPLGFGAGDVNVYAYCADNPVHCIDPFGLWTLQLGVSGSGGLAAGGQGGFGIVFGYSRKYGFQFGVYGMAGVAPGTYVGGGGSLTGEITWSPNEHISDLHGPGVAIGGSASFGPGAGVNIGVEGTIDPCGPKPSYTLSIGGGVGTPEFHIFIGHTSILPIVGKPNK
jgi:RHS repeat-associated protein